MINDLQKKIKKLIKFITFDIWRVNDDDLSNRKKHFFKFTKSFILTFKSISKSNIQIKASALTYQTLLSIIPLLAVLFAIARGFGFQNLIKTQLFDYFPGQRKILTRSMKFIDQSLEYAKGGIFLGIGIILLLYTIIELLNNIEKNFNDIWKIKKQRTFFRQSTDYLALIVIIPIFLICNAGFSLILTTSFQTHLFDLVRTPFLKLAPYLLTIIMFTFLYMYIPNTRVKFSAALFAGIVSGICFQIFQTFYISGQFWITKYNAIYGSFAALPLLLLWLQLSWFICLLGVQLSYSFQNVKKFSFEKETNNISNRYKDFILLLIMTIIIKRFEENHPPYTEDEISENFKIPSQLTIDSLYLLEQCKLIIETPTKDPLVFAYVPIMDINLITLDYFLNAIDRYGSENFKIDIYHQLKPIWDKTLEIRRVISIKEENTLLKNLI